MTSTYLSLPVRLPVEDQLQYNRLGDLTKRVANHVIQRYWTPAHLSGISESAYQALNYFDERQAFSTLDLYLPSRIKRCLLQKVGETLRSHADKRDAFQTIRSILPTHKIRRIHTRQIKETLWDAGDYLSSGYVDSLIGQLNAYYDRHGEYPESYFDVQDCPEYERGVLPYSADDGPTNGQAVKYDYDRDAQTLTIELKTPDTLEPEAHSDWTWTEYELLGYDAFHDLLYHGDLSAPSFHPTETKTDRTYYELLFAVDVERTEKPDTVDTVLAIDGGLRKDATAVVITSEGDQLSRPYFIQNKERERMQRLHRERHNLNAQLDHLRRQGCDHTYRFKHIQSEYQRVNNKLVNKREQLVHDVANQVLALALVYGVDGIVHEDLRSLSPPRGEGVLSWELSKWARRAIIEKIEYRAHIAGLHLEQVYPRGTSRSCPRCGSTGHTTASPDHTHEVWWGGHFRCDNTRCGFQGDRDYVGAVNVARVFFSNSGSLDSGFTSSYTGDPEIVLASRSAGTRLTFGAAPIAYTGQSRVTAGGGSAYIAPAVTPSETKNDSSNRSVSSPATPSLSRFHREPTDYCRK